LEEKAILMRLLLGVPKLWTIHIMPIQYSNKKSKIKNRKRQMIRRRKRRRSTGPPITKMIEWLIRGVDYFQMMILGLMENVLMCPQEN
jgi:hypothetical protein